MCFISGRPALSAGPFSVSMKRIFSLCVAALLALPGLYAQDYHYIEASELTLTGQVFPDTPNPYHRMDTARYKGFTAEEVRLLLEPSGTAVAFRTDSPSIRISAAGPRALPAGASTSISGKTGNGSGPLPASRMTMPWTNRSA